MTGFHRARAPSSRAASGSPTNLALIGRRDDARRLFERLLALRNDVGLLAEEYDPNARRQLGNFPQAFSHISLVDSAYNLSPRETAKPAAQRGQATETTQTT